MGGGMKRRFWWALNTVALVNPWIYMACAAVVLFLMVIVAFI
jgi:hypothetical protein